MATIIKKSSGISKRQLAVILFADIVGYTAVMQKNEHEGLTMIRRFRKVVYETVTLYNGKIYQEYGDGCLCIFSSSINAIVCAKEIQRKLQPPPNVPLRIGIHLGDIVFVDGNIFGNSVNVASRIESLGVAGSVLFSTRLIPDMKNHPEFSCVSLGHFHFKNVESPIEVFALSNDNLIIPKRKEMKGKLELHLNNSVNFRKIWNTARKVMGEFLFFGNLFSA